MCSCFLSSSADKGQSSNLLSLKYFRTIYIEKLLNVVSSWLPWFALYQSYCRPLLPRAVIMLKPGGLLMHTSVMGGLFTLFNKTTVFKAQRFFIFAGRSWVAAIGFT